MKIKNIVWLITIGTFILPKITLACLPLGPYSAETSNNIVYLNYILIPFIILILIIASLCFFIEIKKRTNKTKIFKLLSIINVVLLIGLIYLNKKFINVVKLIKLQFNTTDYGRECDFSSYDRVQPTMFFKMIYSEKNLIDSICVTLTVIILIILISILIRYRNSKIKI